MSFKTCQDSRSMVQTAERSKLVLIANQIEADIRARRLSSGERYHTSAEVAVMFGVSDAMAHRAMGLLVDRQVLNREHGRGTFIGQAMGKRSRVAVRTVYILMESQQRNVTSVPLEEMVEAVRHAIPHVNVQFSFVPDHGAVEYVQELVESAQRAGQFAGAIPISCPREVYSYFAQAHAPVVVLGSLYPDQRQLPSVDMDYHHAGRAMAEYLVGRGHGKIALLNTGGGRPGDNALFDGVSEALTAAGLAPNALVIRVFPHDFDAFRWQIVELLQQADRPTGIICASERLVNAVLSGTRELQLSVPQQIEVVFQSQSVPGVLHADLPYVQPELPFREVAQLLAEMLRKVTVREPLEHNRVVIPVELHAPAAIERTNHRASTNHNRVHRST